MRVFWITLIVGGYVVAPALLIWGWLRWSWQPKQRSLCSILFLASFSLATASALLAFLATMYAYSISGFSYYDPRLLKVFRSGILLSLTGIVLGIGGVWQPSPLRWHAPASAVGTLMFWIMAVSSE
jgi:hypothetical protein